MEKVLWQMKSKALGRRLASTSLQITSSSLPEKLAGRREMEASLPGHSVTSSSGLWREKPSSQSSVVQAPPCLRSLPRIIWALVLNTFPPSREWNVQTPEADLGWKNGYITKQGSSRLSQCLSVRQRSLVQEPELPAPCREGTPPTVF